MNAPVSALTAEMTRRHDRIKKHARLHHAVAVPLAVVLLGGWVFYRNLFGWGWGAEGHLDRDRLLFFIVGVPLALSLTLLALIWRDLRESGRAFAPGRKGPRAWHGFRSLPTTHRFHLGVAVVLAALFVWAIYLCFPFHPFD